MQNTTASAAGRFTFRTMLAGMAFDAYGAVPAVKREPEALLDFMYDRLRGYLRDYPGGLVVISASGMCDAGRIKHHLRHNLGRRECAVVIAGFQAAGTLGRRLWALAAQAMPEAVAGDWEAALAAEVDRFWAAAVA